MGHSGSVPFAFNHHPPPFSMPAQKRKVAEIVDPGSIAQAKRKATKNKKVPIRKASSPESTDSDDNGSAYPSKPIHPISSYNGLDTLPLGMKWQINRRWYFYDIVEPAPRFRPTPNRYKGKKKKPAEVSEGDDSDALSDHSGDEKLPVSWSCYLYVTWLCFLFLSFIAPLYIGENTS
jgi:hypothetical protein